MEEKIEKFQSKLNDFVYIVLAVIVITLSQLIISEFLDLYEKYIGKLQPLNGPEAKGIFMIAFMCIVGPLIESYIIVFMVWLLRDKFHIRKKAYVFWIVTILFTLGHHYSLIYMVGVFPACFVIVYSFLYYKPKKLSPFTVMLLVHILMNSSKAIISLLL